MNEQSVFDITVSIYIVQETNKQCGTYDTFE